MTTKIRECPFCGHVDDVNIGESGPYFGADDDAAPTGRYYTNICGNCGAMGPSTPHAEDVLSLWNHRAPANTPLRPNLAADVERDVWQCDTGPRARECLTAWARQVQEARDYALAKADALATTEAERDRLREALQDAIITFRNYYGHAISRSVVDEKLAQYTAALGAEGEAK